MIRTVSKEAERERERWLKRQAVHIVAQLPEDERDALRVINYARELVMQFLGDDGAGRGNRVLQLVTELDEDIED